jgi:hypothetical protein
MQGGRDGAAVCVAAASVAEKGIHAHYLPARCRVAAKATHTSLGSHFIERHEAAADYRVSNVLLQRDLLDFGFRV